MQQLGKEDSGSCKFITSHQTSFKPAPSGWKWLKLAQYTMQSIFVHAYLWTILEEKCIFWPTYTFYTLQRQDYCTERLSISSTARLWKAMKNCLLTSDLVNQNTRSNNTSILGKELFQFFLGHCFWKSANIQICISDGSWTWPCIRNLRKKTFKKS